MEMRTIEIDFEVHKCIETARESFSDTPNEVLRRLLKLKAGQEPLRPAEPGKPWSSKGVSLPAGTQLKMSYNGVEYRGLIRDGQWHCEGQVYGGPSGAAAGVATTKTGTAPSLNGWVYWQAKLPGQPGWVALSQLRNR